MSDSKAAENALEIEDYVRERLQPRTQDLLYLHLRDLRLAIEEIKTDEPLTLLDYGCGGSPYRSLFPRADYRRADYLEMDRLDYRLGFDSRVSEKDGVFDLILSTQVLEHVPEPQLYLSECFRLLKPGGKVFLTTHGVYPDHGCPYDFHRWTADGLKLALEKAGFREIKVQRLTTGLRALVFLLQYQLSHYRPAKSKTSLKGFSHALGRRLFDLFRDPIHSLCDFCFAGCEKVAEPTAEHVLYICLAIEGRR